MAVNRGMERNSRNYKWAYQSLEKYAGTNDIKFSKMTTKFIQDWMKTLEKTSRAKEMYPICIRMMYNAAMEEYNDYDKNIIRIKLQPFRKIAIPKADVPEKRAVSLDLLKIFFTGTLPETKLKASLPELSRDVAEMVFCLAGMNTADIFELRKSNLKNGVYYYGLHSTLSICNTARKGFDVYDNGRQWKRIRIHQEIAKELHFFLFLQTVPFMRMWSQ